MTPLPAIAPAVRPGRAGALGTGHAEAFRVQRDAWRARWQAEKDRADLLAAELAAIRRALEPAPLPRLLPLRPARVDYTPAGRVGTCAVDGCGVTYPAARVGRVSPLCPAHRGVAIAGQRARQDGRRWQERAA